MLSDDEFFLLEDLVADFVELQSLDTITKEMLGTFEATWNPELNKRMNLDFRNSV